MSGTFEDENKPGKTLADWVETIAFVVFVGCGVVLAIICAVLTVQAIR